MDGSRVAGSVTELRVPRGSGESKSDGHAKAEATGRQDADHQEQPIKIPELKKRLADLLKLGRRLDKAKVQYAEAVKATAEQAGLQTSVVRRFIAARLGESWEKKVRDAKQLALVFDEVGEE